jgi:DNA processing protein
MGDPTSWLTIARAPGLHAGHLYAWLAQGAAASALLRESPNALRSLGLSEPVVRALREPDQALLTQDQHWLAGPQRRLITWGSADYPPLLAAIPDPPLVLFLEGSEAALPLPQLAIVGSRSPSPSGRETATQFAAHLARSGFTITSGLALGIDAAAHRGALQAGGRTVAVLGCGLDGIYPRENTDLAAQIIAQGGALLADLPPGTPPLKQHFPRRNRIISGLSVGTLVVEAALQSGSLITARLAAEQGREVFAIPGSIHNPMSRGCHRLIRQGAKLVESADDIFSELGALLHQLRIESTSEAIDSKTDLPQPLDTDYEILLDALGFESQNVDTLVARSGLKAEEVASMLLILELDGRVEQQPGGRFSRRLPGKV